MEKKEYRAVLEKLKNINRIRKVPDKWDWANFEVVYDNFNRKLIHLFIIYNDLCETINSFSELPEFSLIFLTT